MTGFRCRPWKQVCALTDRSPRYALPRAPAWVERSPRSSFDPLEFVKQRVEPLVAHEAFHALVVDQQHRRVATGAEALAFLQRELAVSTGFPETDAEPALEVLCRVVCAGKRARQI